jgi:hypothetical protein
MLGRTITTSLPYFFYAKTLAGEVMLAEIEKSEWMRGDDGRRYEVRWYRRTRRLRGFETSGGDSFVDTMPEVRTADGDLVEQIDGQYMIRRTGVALTPESS